jgi:hypothetical protein
MRKGRKEGWTGRKEGWKGRRKEEKKEEEGGGENGKKGGSNREWRGRAKDDDSFHVDLKEGRWGKEGKMKLTMKECEER